eukprot:5878294-Amphidinium_carterae.1
MLSKLPNPPTDNNNVVALNRKLLILIEHGILLRRTEAHLQKGLQKASCDSRMPNFAVNTKGARQSFFQVRRLLPTGTYLLAQSIFDLCNSRLPSLKHASIKSRNSKHMIINKTNDNSNSHNYHDHSNSHKIQ